MADDWAGLAAQLAKMQQRWLVTQGSYWSVFDPGSDTATIFAEDGSTRQVPSWRAIANSIASRAVDADTTARRAGVNQQAIDDVTSNGFRPVSYPGYISSLFSYNAGGSTGTVQIEAVYDGRLRWRNQTDGVTWTRWRDVWHSGNFDPTAPRAAAQFTRATLPAAGSMPGGIAYITDGPGGPTHVFSNGQKWRVPALTDL